MILMGLVSLLLIVGIPYMTESSKSSFLRCCRSISRMMGDTDHGQWTKRQKRNLKRCSANRRFRRERQQREVEWRISISRVGWLASYLLRLVVEMGTAKKINETHLNANTD